MLIVWAPANAGALYVLNIVIIPAFLFHFPQIVATLVHVQFKHS